MGLKNNIISINKEFVKKKKFLKKIIKVLIYKSILQNKNVKPILRGFINYKLSKIIWKSCISKQKNNICLITGRFGGFLKKFKISRHQMQTMLKKNNLQNTKINSW